MLGSGTMWVKRKKISLWTMGNVENSKRNASDITAIADAELVGKTRAGDNKAFEVLVRRYQKLVYNIIYQMIRNHDSASDLTQDTFLKAYKALPGFDTTKSFKPWLLKIATNSTLNTIRDQKGQQSLEELLEVNPQAEPASTEDVEQEVEWRVSQHMLFDALGQLPIQQRKTFVLRYQQDLPYEEIAEISELSVSSVKSLLFRARENLRKILSEQLAVSQNV
ncbi:sigma-70 family RNA polymerase sigma factor [Candidatus Obscuribacterales bacterium]|nr:sigma-70 family RNA polymerase sigma factor [Candidatus Obscuribacterales bacterium]